MYKQPYPNLFKPIKIRGMTVKNRIMSSPNMLTQTVDGRPTDYYISYIEHKARGGAGIVTLGEAPVCDGGSHNRWMQQTLDNKPLFAEIAATVHEHGAIASVELTHGGARIDPQYNFTTRFIGPVDTVNMYGAKIYAMTAQDMEHISNAFADSAAYYISAGFDTVLLHCSSGWLLAQFFSPFTNTRTDEFGGSWENRIRFPLMVLERVRERVGPKRPILLRLSGSERRPGGFTVEDIIEFLKKAQEYIDMAEISVEGVNNGFTTTYSPPGQNVDLAATIKRSEDIHIPIYALGSILTPEQAEDIIRSSQADGVSMSRALIADPYLPKKAMASRADTIRPCLRCLNCTSTNNAECHLVCSVNPLIGREARLGFDDNMTKANSMKKVLVVGGGPAGMQAAVIAARRGHDVVLCERSDSLGGLLKFVDGDSLKNDLRRFKDYLTRSVSESGVRVLLNTEATDELVEELSPDSIIVATGSEPIVPLSIKGIERAYHATKAYFDPGTVRGDNIVMIGGGLVGIEASLHLTNIGKNITVLEMLDDYALDASAGYKRGLEVQVSERGLTIITGAKCKEVTDSGVIYEKDGEERIVPCDTALYAVGMKQNDELYFTLYDKAPSVMQIGDCKKVGKVDGAVHTGFFAALDI